MGWFRGFLEILGGKGKIRKFFESLLAREDL